MRARTFDGRLPGGGAIRISCAGATIASVTPIGDDAELPYLSPAFVDLQVNGYAGIDLNGETALTAEAVTALTHRLWREGVCRYLPTLITASQERLLAALRAIARARDQDAAVARTIIGVHVEGPFIAAEDGPRGAHPREYVRPPDIREYRAWQKASGGLVRMVTLCPAQREAYGLIRALAADRIVAAIGHSNADAACIREAVTCGAMLSTHLGNGVASQLPRHPNLIWAQLAAKGLWASFIADGYHLPADTLSAMIRAKGSRAILVSDCVAIGGLAPGRYRTPVGGLVELSPEGRLGVVGTPYLAGAAVPLRDCVAFAANAGAASLKTALAMASSRPAALLGFRHRIQAGSEASFIRFAFASGDRTLNLKETILRGRKVG
jgi:N-acetylglucosamine-6-phosphate deacetylase